MIEGATMPRKPQPKAATRTAAKRLYEAGYAGSPPTAQSPPRAQALWERGSEGPGGRGRQRVQGSLFERGWKG